MVLTPFIDKYIVLMSIRYVNNISKCNIKFIVIDVEDTLLVARSENSNTTSVNTRALKKFSLQ